MTWTQADQASQPLDSTTERPRLAVTHTQQKYARVPRILVAEDDREMRALLVASLRSDGYEVIEAANGLALIHEFSRLLAHGNDHLVDLVVSDERMPGCLGTEVLAGLREFDWRTPFILITAFGDAQTHRTADLLGAAAVFDKPFDLDEFRDSVRTILHRGPSPATRDRERGDDPGV